MPPPDTTTRGLPTGVVVEIATVEFLTPSRGITT